MKDSDLRHEFMLNGDALVFHPTIMASGFRDDLLSSVQAKPAAASDPRFVQPFGITFLSLHVAHECPLACAYCYGTQGDYGSRCGPRMAEATMRQAVDYQFRYPGPGSRLHINFFGGEPLLAFEEVRNTVAYAFARAQEAGRRMEFSLSTSGVGMDEAWVDFLAQHKFSVSVSLDCNRETHDRHRRQATGGPSYDEAVRGLEMLHERRVRTLVTATLSKETYLAIGNYRNLIALGADNFRFKVVTGNAGGLGLRPEDYAALAAAYEDVANCYLEDILAGHRYDFGDFTKWIHRLESQQTVAVNCTASLDYINVDPEGNIFICHKFVGGSAGCLGHVRNLEKPVLPLGPAVDQTLCHGCWAHLLCGGGCYYDSFEASGDFLRAGGTGKCAIHRAQIEGAIYIRAHLKRQNRLTPFLESLASGMNPYQRTV